MSKIRRGGYVFITWAGDHTPRHVHVYKNGRFLLKWDLENGEAMKGRISKKAVEYIVQLQIEGVL